jgi:hypothetical protein
MKFEIIVSSMMRVFPIRKLKPGGAYYLSTGAKSIYSITTPFEILMKLCTCPADGYNNQCWWCKHIK